MAVHVDRHALRAARALAGISTGLRLNTDQMQEVRAGLSQLLTDIHDLATSQFREARRASWNAEWSEFQSGVEALRADLIAMQERVGREDTVGVAAAWSHTLERAETLDTHHKRLEEIGSATLTGQERQRWGELWTGVLGKVSLMMAHANACQLQLNMLEQYGRVELDRLTASVLKHIPSSYSLKAADAYVDEYVAALEEIERENAGNKNLWDRFLDVLAGGVQQSPAERVMMQRWLKGERGDLE